MRVENAPEVAIDLVLAAAAAELHNNQRIARVSSLGPSPSIVHTGGGDVLGPPKFVSSRFAMTPSMGGRASEQLHMEPNPETEDAKLLQVLINRSSPEPKRMDYLRR